MLLQCLICLHATAAPTSSFTFLLNMHDNLHAAVFEELNCAHPHVFKVCGVRGDDVDDAEDTLRVRCVAVIVIVIMIMRMRVVVGMVVRMPVVVVMFMIVVAMAMFVLMSAVMIGFFSMRFGMRGTFVLEPEFRHCVSNDSA